MRRMILFFLCAVLLLSGCARQRIDAPELLEPVDVAIDSVVVTRGEIFTIATYDAALMPHVEELYFTIDGTIGQWNVVEGQLIAVGDTIATLDQSKLKEEIASLQAAIAFAEKELQYQTDILAIDIQMKELALAHLQNEVVMADQQAKQQSDMNLLRIEIEELQLESKQRKQAARLELDTLRSTLKTLQGKLNHGKITAPHSGRIVYSAQQIPGDPVKAYAPVAYIASDTDCRVESAFIFESLLAGAHELYALIGEKKYPLVHIPTEQREYMEAIATGIPMKSKFTIGGAEEAQNSLTAGTYAAVCVITDYAADALIIPTSALYSGDGVRYVYVMQEDARVRREVKAGISNSILTQVLSGLEEGEAVYVQG